MTSVSPANNPFDPRGCGPMFAALIKNMERRWGLTLVSFLPREVHEPVVRLQQRIAGLLDIAGAPDLRRARCCVELHPPEQLHCTHLTLARSNPQGPVRLHEFVRPGHDLYELFAETQAISSQLAPLQVQLDHLAVARDGIGLVLLGRCVGDGSTSHRQRFIEELSTKLGLAFQIEPKWDVGPARCVQLHCSLGHLKRAPPLDYGVFVREMSQFQFAPVSFTLPDITLVHHRYRTLEFPQEGSVDFSLGQRVERVELSAEEFSRRLGLLGSGGKAA